MVVWLRVSCGGEMSENELGEQSLPSGQDPEVVRGPSHDNPLSADEKRKTQEVARRAVKKLTFGETPDESVARKAVASGIGKLASEKEDPRRKTSELTGTAKDPSAGGRSVQEKRGMVTYPTLFESEFEKIKREQAAKVKSGGESLSEEEMRKTADSRVRRFMRDAGMPTPKTKEERDLLAKSGGASEASFIFTTPGQLAKTLPTST